MAQQSEEQIRQEAKSALLAAFNALKRILGPDKEEAIFCLRLGRAYSRAGSSPLKYLNELLAEALEKLSSRGRQAISADVFGTVEKAIETTGAAIFYDETVGKQTK